MTDTDNKKINSLGGNGAAQLCAYVKRVERLEEEIAALNTDKKEVYAEAKAIGLCKKTLQKVIRRRRQDDSAIQEEDAMLELYEAAIFGIKEKIAKDPLED